jgi:hypothetical protein
MLLKNYGRNIRLGQKARVFISGRSFQPSLISVSKARANPSLPATFKVEESVSLPLFKNAFLSKLFGSKNDQLEPMLLKNYGRNLRVGQKARVFISGRPFQPRLIGRSIPECLLPFRYIPGMTQKYANKMDALLKEVFLNRFDHSE